MDAGFLRFDPAEFEVIETIDFEEEVAKPESLRFFTLDEQLSDYFDKVLPKKKVITKFEYKQIATEIDRLRDIYRDIITVTDTDYIVDLTRKTINVPWVKPIYSALELSSYSYTESWIPLFMPPLRSAANYYPRMLTALPKPYTTAGDGTPLLENATVVDEEGKNEINALGIYHRTRGVTHEDGTFTVIDIPIANTADDIKTRGFFIEPRKLEIPNPLADHPFLGSNKSSKIITEEALLDVFPTVETIMTHGVPKTEHPYTEGLQFLKIYDVKLNQIPWSSWKDSFPPAGTISATPPIMSVVFPKGEAEDAPSKSLQDSYSIPWMSGVEPRHWLSSQEDGGSLVVKMLLSKASNAGLLAPAILHDKPEVQLTSSTPEECLVLDSFDSFLNSGVYRTIGKKGYCIPTTYILQEKIEMMAAKKIAWTETTEIDMLTTHQKMLKERQQIENKPVVPKYEKYATRPPSELRRMILAVMADKERLQSDKFVGIEILLKNANLKEEVYFDDDDSFLICSHAMAILKGDMEDDEKAFFLKWTAVEDGYRTCIHCSERVSANVFAAVDDFDENGNPIISSAVLGGGPAFIGDTHVVTFSSSLSQLRSAFNLDNAGESILYLLISLLQVLPSESQLLPVLQNLRDVTKVLKSKTTILKEAKDRTEGILGLAAAVVLLQTHEPFLLPRRSFGSKILKLSGFPRDTDDEKDSPVLDVIITVLKTTFESTPGSFKGPITAVLRKIISKPKEVRKESVVFIKQVRKKFETQFLSAKERYVSPVETEIVGQLSLPVLRLDKTDYSTTERIGSEERLGKCDIVIPKTYLSGSLPPSVIQDSLELAKTGVNHGEGIKKINEEKVIVTVDDKSLRERLGIGFPKTFVKINAFLKSDAGGIAFLSLLNRILDILSATKFPLEKLKEYRRISVFLQTKISQSVLRDQVRGYMYQLFGDIGKDKGYTDAINKAIQRDLTLNMLLITKEEATAQDSELRTRERELFKQRMRQMDDSQREVTKMMLDIGIAPYIITNEDREIFKQEYGYTDPEEEYEKIVGEDDLDRPEDGEAPEDDERLMDNGAYGDAREELYERGDYGSGNFDNEEGYGV